MNIFIDVAHISRYQRGIWGRKKQGAVIDIRRRVISQTLRALCTYLGKVLKERRVFWEHEVAGSTPAA